MKAMPKQRIEFIAKTFTDLGKALFVLGVASTFFEKFPFVWRIVLTAFSVVLILVGILLIPIEGGDDQ